MTKKEINELINPNEFYSLYFIKDHNIFGSKVPSTVKDRILKDSVRENYLKADYTGEGKATAWLIKGKNIIKYLEANNLITN